MKKLKKLTKDKKDQIRKDLLIFKERKLSKKARDYRDEITEITLVLLEINRKIHESGKLSLLRPWCFGEQENARHLTHTRFGDYILDLNYHMENYILRLQAYRDKLALLINYALDLECDEKEMGLIYKIKNKKLVKKANLQTELNKLTRKKSSIYELLEKRKKISHKLYYNSPDYNPLFIPREINPKKVGQKKASKKWQQNISSEVSKYNTATKNILKINRAVSDKIIKFFKS